MSQESIPPAVDYSRVFSQAIDRLHTEGRYRVFIDILRNKGAFPNARCFAGHNGPKPITVWCSNDYLSMGQHQIGRAHVRTPVTNAHLVCRLLLEKKKKTLT